MQYSEVKHLNARTMLNSFKQFSNLFSDGSGEGGICLPKWKKSVKMAFLNQFLNVSKKKDHRFGKLFDPPWEILEKF